MGSEFDSVLIHAQSPEELRARYDSVRRHREWEYGHGGYTGTFAEAEPGLEVQEGTWTRKEAEAHCSEHHHKWSAAWAYDLGNDAWFVGAWCSS